MTTAITLQLGDSNRTLHRLAILLAVATSCLMFVGGSVTSNGAGLAVPDWPTTFGQNMFLFPPSRWIGGVLYEHGHRLTGAAVGMIMIVMTAWAHWREPRRRVRVLTVIMLGAVIVQGVMGGLRVTERSITLAIVHACFAPMFLCTTFCLVAVTSRTWINAPDLTGPAPARWLKWLCVATATSSFCQIVAGAVYRHLRVGINYHIVGAIVLTTMVCAIGIALRPGRADDRLSVRITNALAGLLATQLILGVWSYMIVTGINANRPKMLLEWLLPSAHVAVGGAFFASSVALVLSLYCRQRRAPFAHPVRPPEILAP